MTSPLQTSPPLPPQGGEQKPVAWRLELDTTGGSWKTEFFFHEPQPADNVRNVVPLYDHPAAVSPQVGEAKAVAPEESKSVSGMENELQALEAIKNRAMLAYKLCCGLAPKQAVGELIDTLINMSEWGAVAAGLKEVKAIPHWDVVPPMWLNLYMVINQAVIHAGQYGDLEAKSPLIDAVDCVA